MSQSDKDLAKIAKDATPRRHAAISPIKVKDTHIMINKPPPAEILCGEWRYLSDFFSVCASISRVDVPSYEIDFRSYFMYVNKFFGA